MFVEVKIKSIKIERHLPRKSTKIPGEIFLASGKPAQSTKVFK
jgi:hypothetical protein